MGDVSTGSAYTPIADYALLGDCRTAALVSKAGSLDWLCLPRFDGPAFFAALLDAERGGRFAVRPAAPSTAERRYLGRSNVLETTFTTDRGVVRLTDAMAVPCGSDAGWLHPDHEILRRVECLAGEVEVELLCDPRPDFGRRRARLRRRGRLGWSFEAGRDALLLQSDLPLAPVGGVLAGRETLRAGERRWASLATSHGEPLVAPPLGEAAAARLAATRRFWDAWIGRSTYDGPYREAMLRSALALKLLTYSPSGAVVAAPTTSLPEALGGSRNWDYRYCWLRDASWTLLAFLDLGLVEEGKAFLSWLLHATRLHHPELAVIYDVHGNDRLEERELGHLEGYAGSRPVRLGNGAAGQLQLDVYGEVVEAAFRFVDRGGELDPAQASLIVRLGETVCRLWPEPDEGIWEKRSGRFHHTHSKVLCWAALDRVLRLEERGLLRGPAARSARRRRARFTWHRDEIRRRVEGCAFRPHLGRYADVLGEDGIDASLLLLGIYGFADPRSPRFAATAEAVIRELSSGALVHRYPPGSDGLAGGEGAFGACSFWAVETLARMGEAERAAERFERLLGCANDLGLFAEEIDPGTGASLGNFPQAFSHVALISAGLTLADAAGEGQAPEAAIGTPKVRT